MVGFHQGAGSDDTYCTQYPDRRLVNQLERALGEKSGVTAAVGDAAFHV